MALRSGLGPVFAYEWLTRSRRWQGYALRTFFVVALLVGLGLVWQSATSNSSLTTRQQLAQVGESFYLTMTVIELSLVLLAAPAATAGAICLDKSRGTLAHVMVTDLTDREVVLGKLGARSLSILNLIACALPVAALGSLLGGIDPMALTGSFLIVCGVAILGCSLALAVSVWASKAHEVMFVIFACWLLWLLPLPVSWINPKLFGGTPRWLEASNPFWLALAPYLAPSRISIWDPILFAAACLVASILLAILSVVTVRPVSLRQAGRVPKRSVDSRAAAWFRGQIRWWPGPSLDRNPVLWREWRQTRSSRVVRIIWTLYLVAISVMSIYLIIEELSRTSAVAGLRMAPLFNGIHISIGLLFVAASAGTVLSEERTRGSLDVLLATPLSTRSIVWGKWWGAYRQIPWLAFWPFVMAYCLMPRFAEPPVAVLAFFIPLMILIQGAVITSLGLALATWISRPGLVVTWTIAAVVASVVGWPIADGLIHHSETSLSMGSPFYNVGLTMYAIEQRNGGALRDVTAKDLWIVLTLCAVVYASIALGLYMATLKTFERCLGRTSEIARLPGRAPAKHSIKEI